jgi:hypothetical protein
MTMRACVILLALGGCKSSGLVEEESGDADSTGTLWVSILVSGGFVSGMAPQATIDVGVWEMTTRAPAPSARVMGGPVGAPIEIPEDPTNPGFFRGSRDLFSAAGDYTRVWEFSIERGPDHVRRAILVAPSYPSVQFSDDNDGLHVSWSPNHEAGVASGVLVQREIAEPAPSPYTSPPAPPSWSSNSATDDGTAGPFAIPPLAVGDSYLITVARTHIYQPDWGRASIGVSGEASIYGP